VTLKPKTKTVLVTLGVFLPYFVIAFYFAFRIQRHPLPAWFPYFGLSYMLAGLILIPMITRRISRGAQPQIPAAPQPVRQLALRAYAGYLILIWSGLFLYGAYLTIIGNLEWRRAIPAGAFLLAFIALFSRLLYTDIKHPSRPLAPPDAKTPSKS
jgi:hypothetical protein